MRIQLKYFVKLYCMKRRITVSSLKCFHINTSTESSYELLSITFAHSVCSKARRRRRVVARFCAFLISDAGWVLFSFESLRKINDLALSFYKLLFFLVLSSLFEGGGRSRREEYFHKIVQTLKTMFQHMYENECAWIFTKNLIMFTWKEESKRGARMNLKFNCQFVVCSHSFVSANDSAVQTRTCSSLVQMSGGKWKCWDDERMGKWWKLKAGIWLRSAVIAAIVEMRCEEVDFVRILSTHFCSDPSSEKN